MKRWAVITDREIRGRLVSPPSEVGRFRFRWVAVLVATWYALADNWAGAYVIEVKP